MQVYELDEDRTSNGRENASTAFARESRAATGGSEESARGKRAREREECKGTAEGSSEKEAHLIRVEGNGREARWWCDRAPPRRCCTYIRGSLYECLCAHTCEEMYACPIVVVFYSRAPPRLLGESRFCPLCKRTFAFFTHFVEKRMREAPKICASSLLPPLSLRTSFIVSYRS